MAFGDHIAIDLWLGIFRVNSPADGDIHLRGVGMFTVGTGVSSARLLPRKPQMLVPTSENLNAVVQQHPPQHPVRGATMGNDETRIVERHALCIGSRLARCELGGDGHMDVGTYGLGTLDEESAE